MGILGVAGAVGIKGVPGFSVSKSLETARMMIRRGDVIPRRTGIGASLLDVAVGGLELLGIASDGLGESLLGVDSGGFEGRKYLRCLGLAIRSVYAPESSS